MVNRQPVSIARFDRDELPKSLQLGIALGLAIIASITASVNASHTSAGSNPGYEGVAAGYWFILGLVILFAVMVLIFYESERPEATSTDEEQSFGDHELSARKDSICFDVRPGTSRTSIVVLPSRSSHEQREIEATKMHIGSISDAEGEGDNGDGEDDDEKKDVIDNDIGRQSVRTSIVTFGHTDVPPVDGYGCDRETASLSTPDWEPRRPERARSRNSTVRFSLQLQDDESQGVDFSDARSEARRSGQFNRANSINRRGR